MEKNQLNFNAPIISARRYSSPVRSTEKVLKTNTEKLLKSRQTSLPAQQSNWELAEVATPGTVPFQWEKIPGKAIKENEPESLTNTPRLPPQYTPKNISGNLLEMMKKGANNNTDCENNYENGDDKYSDIIDALSLSDSRSMSCSVSILSGYYNPEINSDSRGNFSADVATRDFMMNRFLPAAKAMVLKTPQYASKKQSVVNQEPKEPIRKVAIVEKRALVEIYRSHIVPDYGEYSEMESENGIEEFVDLKKTPRKVFGLFSKFCLKNSLRLLNPVSSIKAKINSPMGTPKKSSNKKSSAYEIGKVCRKAYSGPLTQTYDKYSGNNSTRKRFGSISRSQELYTVKTKPSNDSPRLSHSGELRATRGSSPYRSYTRGGLSPYRSEITNSPLRKNTSFVGVTKNGEKLKVVKNPIIPKIEKTIYVDEKIETKNAIIVRPEAEDIADVATLHPPLPKSPSESWLWRTLPSINYSKNKQAKASKTVTKWETIVKTSNVHHDHIRYSEELVPHLSQHRKT